jgi:hypothetical protein
VSRQLSSLAPQIGVCRLTLQALRYTFFTRLANAGLPAIVIKEIGGWKSYGAPIKFVMHHSEISRAYYSALDQTNGKEQ